MFEISAEWQKLLKGELESENYKNLCAFLKSAYANGCVYPPQSQVFAAINLVALDQVRVVIIGQDPYHQRGRAHGLAFSVKEGSKLPPSLRNIFKEISLQFGTTTLKNGDLTRWAKQGVLLLNAVLTVEEGLPNSHSGKGWESITRAIIKQVNNKSEPVVFLLWGKNAQEFLPLINRQKHFVKTSAHPSPMSANRGGWWGQAGFKECNNFLTQLGGQPINW